MIQFQLFQTHKLSQWTITVSRCRDSKFSGVLCKLSSMELFWLISVLTGGSWAGVTEINFWKWPLYRIVKNPTQIYDDKNRYKDTNLKGVGFEEFFMLFPRCYCFSINVNRILPLIELFCRKTMTISSVTLSIEYTIAISYQMWYNNCLK